MGVAFWRDDVEIKREEVDDPFRGGPSGRAQRRDVHGPVELMLEANASAAAMASA